MQAYKIFLPVFIFTFLHSVEICAQNWVQTDPFPGTPRDDGSAFTIGNTAYFGSGLEVGWQPTRDFYAYSFAEGWSPIASLPEGNARQYACGCADGAHGYIFGGAGANSSYFNDLWRYAPDTDTWTAMSPLPAAGRSGMACFEMDGKLYVVGGRTDEDTYTAEGWMYTIESDSWEQIADYPGGPVWRLQAGVQGTAGNRAVFVSTGLKPDGSYHGAVFAYLEATEGWSGPLGNLPGGGRMYAAMGTYQNTAVLFGGQDEDDNFMNDLWSWQWNGLLWEELNGLPSTARRGGMLVNLNGDLIYTTGLNPDFERIQETWTTNFQVSVENANSGAEVALYPNPGNDSFRILGDLTGVVHVRMYSLEGKMVHSARVAENEAIAVGHLPKGMYIIDLSSADGLSVHIKWVKH